MKFLDRLKGKKKSELLSYRGAAELYDSIYDEIDNQCVLVEQVSREIEELQLADIIGRAFIIEGLTVTAKFTDKDTCILTFSGWDVELEYE